MDNNEETPCCNYKSPDVYDKEEIEAWLQYHRSMYLIECGLPKAPIAIPERPSGEDPFEGAFEFLIADWRFYPDITGEIY